MSRRESLTLNEIVTPAGKRILLAGTAAPTTGTWAVGDTVLNSAPSAGGTFAWVCTTAGTTGGTWKAIAVAA